MKIFITGTNGQLGYDVAKQCLEKGYKVFGCGTQSKSNNELKIQYIQLDLIDKITTLNIIKQLHPNIIIHCAAWTNVDKAEDNFQQVFNINVEATATLATAAKLIDAKIVYISTDYVFNGYGKKAWEPNNICRPLNTYGMTKWQGELQVQKATDKYFIIRTQWVFGKNGNNFVKTMINVGKKYPEVKVVNDQIGRPTYTVDLARAILDYIQTEDYGIYHITNSGNYVSWYNFCCEIYKQYELNTIITPVSTEEYGAKAIRPKNGRLKISKDMPDWHDALSRYLQEVKL